MSSADRGGIARALTLALLPAALLATSAFAQPKRSEDWTGVWTRIGSFSYDPSIRPEQRENVPYKPDWQARYEKALADAARGEASADPTAACLPPGMPRMMNMVYPMEIIDKPGQMTIVAEWESQVRRIFLDGRQHPEDADPSFNGHSIGHWEGKTLVVDTVGMRDDTTFDQSGIRHSDKLRLTERFTMTDPNMLELVITADDPVAFTHPWVVTKRYKRAPDVQIMEYVCAENNRNPIGADGKIQTILQGVEKK